MNLVKTNNWLPSIFDDMLNNAWVGHNDFSTRIGTHVPAVNIKENNDNFVVEVAAPGKQKEDFKIELDHHLLTISSEAKEENNVKNEQDNFTRREFSYHSFKRSFTLPESIDSSMIEANYENGVLNITLPKREEAKVQPKRLIEIA